MKLNPKIGVHIFLFMKKATKTNKKGGIKTVCTWPLDSCTYVCVCMLSMVVLPYGNMGCQIFKRGYCKDFCLKINIPRCQKVPYFIEEYQFRNTFFVIDIF